MKKRLLLLALPALHFHAIGQANTEVQQWISLHPKVHLMSEENYQLLSEENKARFKDHILVYHETITINQLLEYDGMEKSSETKPGASKDSDASEIKEWLAFHPDIKVIPQSQFAAMTQERQQLYQQAGSLILIGETITIEDIRNY